MILCRWTFRPLKFNNFTPEKWRLEDDPFLLGFGNFSGAIKVKLSGGYFIRGSKQPHPLPSDHPASCPPVLKLPTIVVPLLLPSQRLMSWRWYKCLANLPRWNTDQLKLYLFQKSSKGRNSRGTEVLFFFSDLQNGRSVRLKLFQWVVVQLLNEVGGVIPLKSFESSTWNGENEWFKIHFVLPNHQTWLSVARTRRNKQICW